MKKFIFFIVLMISFNDFNFARGIVASITHAGYHSSQGDFVDVFIEVLGSSMSYISLDSNYIEGRLGVVILIKGEEGVEALDSLILTSPRSKKVLDFKHAFRYPLDNGHYIFDVELFDIYKPNNKLKAEFEVDLQYEPSSVNLSDILLLASFEPSHKISKYVKSGVYLEPLPFNICEADMRTLSYYVEVYGTDESIPDAFVLKIQIFKDSIDGKLVSEQYKRANSGEVVPMLLISPIEDLTAGLYCLRIQVLDRNKRIYNGKAIFFRKFEHLTQKDSADNHWKTLEWVNSLSLSDLRYSLKAISPIAEELNQAMNKAILKNDISEMRRLLVKYWLKSYPRSSEEHYHKFMNVAKYVDERFKSGFGYGFETDRGRVFLKYGKPSQVITETAEPEAYPYEIWVYNRTPDGQTRVKFLFYNPSLAADQMILLHSTAIGETYNDKWERILYGKATSDPQPSNYLDEKHVQDGFLRRAREYFEDN